MLVRAMDETSTTLWVVEGQQPQECPCSLGQWTKPPQHCGSLRGRFTTSNKRSAWLSSLSWNPVPTSGGSLGDKLFQSVSYVSVSSVAGDIDMADAK